MKADRSQILIAEAIDVRPLAKLNPLLSLGSILLQWGMIISAIILHHYFPTPWTYVLVWLLIGSRMYAMYALLHDGMHFLIFPQKSINDIICKVFLAWPLFISFQKIRQVHFSHHKYLKTPEDPESSHTQYDEFQFPKSIFSISKIFLLDILGINFIYYKLKKIPKLFMIFNREKSIQMSSVFVFITFIVLCILLFITDLWLEFIIYWIIPYVTIYQALNRLRLSTEHIHVDAESIFQTRTVKLGIIGRFIFSPNFLGYHTEHHLFPAVPFYRLPDLHEKLMEVPDYKSNIQLYNSYLFVFKDYVRKSSQ